MKKLLCLVVVLTIFSCKTQQNPDALDGIDESEIINDPDLTRDIEIAGKIIDNKNKRLGYVAVKLVINSNECLSTTSDAKGNFKLTVNSSKVEENTVLELVYKGFTKKVVDFKDAVKWKSFSMKKEGDEVSRVDYRIYYDNLQKCSNQEK